MVRAVPGQGASRWTITFQVLDAGIASLAGNREFIFVVQRSRLRLRGQAGFQPWIGVGVILGGVVMIGLS